MQNVLVYSARIGSKTTWRSCILEECLFNALGKVTHKKTWCCLRSIPEDYGLIGMFNPNASALDLPAESSNSCFDFSYNDFTGNLPMFLESHSVPFKVQQNVRLGVSIFTNSDIAKRPCHVI